MYILKIFSQERWLKHVGIGKVFFPHHSWLQCTKLSEFMVGWLLGGKIYRGVSLAPDKKRQHFGDPQLSPLLFQGEFVGEGMHRKEVRQQLMLQELNAEEEDSEAWSNPIQVQAPKGSERNRVISVAHPTPLHKDTTARLEKVGISPHSPASLFTSLLQIKLCQGHSFGTVYTHFPCEQRK